MLLVVTLNIVSCTDLNDNPVVYGPLDEVLAANECFSDIKEQEVMDFISSYIY